MVVVGLKVNEIQLGKKLGFGNLWLARTCTQSTWWFWIYVCEVCLITIRLHPLVVIVGGSQVAVGLIFMVPRVWI